MGCCRWNALAGKTVGAPLPARSGFERPTVQPDMTVFSQQAFHKVEFADGPVNGLYMGFRGVTEIVGQGDVRREAAVDMAPQPRLDQRRAESRPEAPQGS